MTEIMRTGYCRYCGQSRVVRHAENLSKEDIDNVASYECDCYGAAEARATRDRARNARFMISNVVEPYSEDAGRAMRYAAKAVAEGRIQRITIKINKRYTAVMAAGDKISVTLRETDVTTEQDFEDDGSDRLDGIDGFDSNEVDSSNEDSNEVTGEGEADE